METEFVLDNIRSGRPAIISTHDLRAIKRICQVNLLLSVANITCAYNTSAVRNFLVSTVQKTTKSTVWEAMQQFKSLFDNE